MILSKAQWDELTGLQTDELKGRVFTIIQNASKLYHSRDTDDPEILEIVPRLERLLDSRSDLEPYREVLSAFARSVGLWNYIDKEKADSRDLLVAEAVTVERLGGISLHREQIAVLNALLSGKNIILSAPTSFGKSLLIDALLASGKYNRIAIVLPTIALLDEFRRRLSSRFAEEYSILMYHSQVTHKERVIFLGTQERLINRPDLLNLDLVVVDEFYKLDPNRQDDRSLTLNAAVYQLLKRAKQFFFLGPNISNVRFDQNNKWRFEFIGTRFSTVAVDTYDLRAEDNKQARLEDELRRPENWPALVFVSSPDRANKLASELSKELQIGGDPDFATWIGENLGQGWQLQDFVASGIAVHHGRIPRAIASLMVRLFNACKLPVLLCTSTLIEGVNTAAKTVLIYDKQINRRDYDFFTFANIRGRAGRLGAHQVGSVYLFHSPPDGQGIDVDPPLFGDMDRAPNEMVVQLEESDANSVVNERILGLAERLGLTVEELRTASSVGIEDAASLKAKVEEAFHAGSSIFWSVYPKYPEILATCKIICAVRPASEYGARSDRHLAYLINELRYKSSMRNFFLSYSASFRGKPVSQDEVFRFLRACEYGLPQMFAVLELFARKLSPSVDYRLFLADLPRWFRAEVLKNLDEQGVPIQISERFWKQGDDLEELSSRLTQSARQLNMMTQFEAKWVIDALD